MIGDCIAAISTSLAPSGVAVIRMSGDGVLEIAEKMFIPVGKTKVKDFIPNKMYVGEVLADGFNDYGMCVYFKSPKSFTGEDSVEFHIHGGIAITKGVLRSCLSNGARLATKGEFTKRAFINGKLSLSSAEGLIDMINSETEGSVKAGYYLYREKLSNKITDLQNSLLDALSEIEADMDFPEEDLEVNSRLTAKKTIAYVLKELESLLYSYRTGRTIKNGVKIGIVGKPNTGKSSLLNALLNYDKAIVSDIAGTTRDVVEGNIDINGVRFFFSDTAGIRESSDKIESLGVDLSNKILKESDLVLFVVDKSDFDKNDKEILDKLKNINKITVINKCDINSDLPINGDLEISALHNINIEKLKELIYTKTVESGFDLNSDFLCEERHFNAIKSACEILKSALENIDSVQLDLLAIDVKMVWSKLGEITGKTASEDIIDNIFKKFCVGK